MKNRDTERIKLYRDHRNKVGEDILRAVLRSLASADSNSMITEILQVNLNLSGVALDEKEFDGIVIKVLRSEIAHILISSSILPKEEQEQLSKRIIAGIAPFRDNLYPLSQQTPNRKRIEGVEEAIKRELAHLEKTL